MTYGKPHTTIVEYHFWRKRDAVAFNKKLRSAHYIAHSVETYEPDQFGKKRRGARVRAWPRLPIVHA